MTNPLQRVQAGQDFEPQAETWNLFCKATEKTLGQVFESSEPWDWDRYEWYHAYLTSDLGAGSSTSPTTCTANIYFRDDNTPGRPLVVSSNSQHLGVTIVNFDASCTAVSNTYCKIEPDGPGQFSLKWLGCAPE